MMLTGYSEEEIEKILKHFTREYECHFWGEKHIVKPCLIEHIHGDGLQLVYLTPLDTRPNYYLLRIDSSIDISDDESLNEEDFEYYGSVCELLLQMVEEEHINIEHYDETGEGLYINEDGDTFEFEFPMLSCSSGVSWGLEIS